MKLALRPVGICAGAYFLLLTPTSLPVAPDGDDEEAAVAAAGVTEAEVQVEEEEEGS